MAPIRVLVADDHALFRAGVRKLLQSFEGMDVVGEAADGHEALRLSATHRPDVLLMDIGMPGLNGVEAAARLTREGPRPRVIILSMHTGEEYVLRAIRAGAAGYLLKDAAPAEVEAAIRAVHRGEGLLDPAVTAAVLAEVARPGEHRGSDPAATTAPVGSPAGPSPASADPGFASLTPREREVLGLLGRGLTNAAIARELFVAEKTVKTHVSSILAKLRLADRTQAALYAARLGLSS